ncbi:cancer-related nucleoside-triphosphatase isoform X1 [Aquila chrysaetos chrysaetos]|uniref:cancer-related nucleoside-triphosphatase isoform X1 n=1 Tax=Aquila chrysaetos chrysaetos TaxID=223781 RepID=UPI0011764E46|nr:cancer-related nucleoside-triphosphatase isoform X1 [Aquila chrysaetos chrysaetos]
MSGRAGGADTFRAPLRVSAAAREARPPLSASPQAEGEGQGRSEGAVQRGDPASRAASGGGEGGARAAAPLRHVQARFSHRTPSSDSSTSRREYRVGQYVVDLVSFEQLVLPMLRNVNHGSDAEKKICVIDEIGKMELFSQPFIQAVRQTLTGSGTVVLGTIPIPKGKPLDLVEEIRSRKDVKVFNVSKENRNSILQDILAAVESCRK